MKIYISGKITGDRRYKAKFREVEKKLAAALIGAAFRTARERRRKERAAKYIPVVLESAINVQRSLLRDITASEDQSQINTWRKSVVKMTLAALNEKRERMIKNGAEK